MTDADTYRDAIRLIRMCGKEMNAKTYAFGKASEWHAKGDMKEATRWSEIANAVDVLLKDIKNPELISIAVH